MELRKNKKILLILTGGTICSTVKENCRTLVGSHARSVLIDRFDRSSSRYAGKVEFTVSDDRGIFSENITIDRYNEWIDYLRNFPVIIEAAQKKPKSTSAQAEIAHEKNGIDGIIIAHGTDTLGFSAPLFSLLLSSIGVPVFLAAANEPLSSERSNGHDNFRFAIERICEGIEPDVYVAYRNPTDGIMYLHSAERLCQSRSRAGDFYSADMVNTVKEQRIPRHRTETDRYGNLFGAWHLRDSVLILHPYVGLNYDRIDFTGATAILHGSYHSGTVCAEQTVQGKAYGSQSILRLIDRLSETNRRAIRPIPLIITPARLTGEVYDTVPFVKKHAEQAGNVPIYFCDNDSEETLYAKLLLAAAWELPIEKTEAFLGI